MIDPSRGDCSEINAKRHDTLAILANGQNLLSILLGSRLGREQRMGVS